MPDWYTYRILELVSEDSLGIVNKHLLFFRLFLAALSSQGSTANQSYYVVLLRSTYC